MRITQHDAEPYRVRAIVKEIVSVEALSSVTRGEAQAWTLRFFIHLSLSLFFLVCETAPDAKMKVVQPAVFKYMLVYVLVRHEQLDSHYE